MINDITNLCLAAERWYNFNERHYHDWEHALSVADSVLDSRESTDALMIAAYWHDAVYIPTAIGNGNEFCSAAAMENESKKYNIDQKIIDTARMLIEFTTIETHLHVNAITGDLAVLLDADINSLSYNWNYFVNNQDDIILEQYGNIETDRKKCAAFLSNFLHCREFIYHTDWMRENREELARKNITRYIKEFGE